MRVLYILGHQRGGTTIVGRVLGLVDGVAYAGEVRRIWEFGTAPERTCGCGLRLSACPVWSVVLDHVRTAGIDPAEVPAWQRAVLSGRGSWSATAALTAPRRRSSASASAAYARAMAATYAGLAEAYGVEVLVDNSKLPRDGAFLANVEGVSPAYLHLTRDPRGVVASQLRRRTSLGPARRTAEAAVLSAGWVARHTSSRVVRSAAGAGGVEVRYEDFVADPQAAAGAVCRLVGVESRLPSPPPFRLPAVHTPRGPNPAAEVTLVEDTAWRRELGAVDRAVVTVLTSPWLARHRYLGAHGRPTVAFPDTRPA